MPAFVPITIHESQWPGVLAAQLRECLRLRQLNHKFLYDSPRQVRSWLRLHECYSPARKAAAFNQTYAPAFQAVAKPLENGPVHLIGLGCGGGQKESALLATLVKGNRPVTFTATDVSSGMVVTAMQAAWNQVPTEHCSGLVCDLAVAHGLDRFFEPQTPKSARRVNTFFGMIPNFEPDTLRELLRELVRPGDLFLCSANLAPGPDYQRGVEQVLPQYANALTREWLGLWLSDVGIAHDAGEIHFLVEEAPAGAGLLRIEARFEFHHPAVVLADGNSYEFENGSHLRLFFSYRHTAFTLAECFKDASLQLLGSWVSESGEEGVFLAAR